jgi:hypothetical protein
MATTSLAQAQSHTLPPETFLAHDQAIRVAKREAEDANAALARAKKAAKNAAVNMTAYKVVQIFDKLDDDEQPVVMGQIVAYMRHRGMPVGTQYSLLDAPQVPPPGKPGKPGREVTAPAVFDASEAGLRAGRAGDSASSNPQDPGSEEHVAWARSHSAGLAERATASRMADTENERPADVAPATRKAAQGRGRAGKVAQSIDNARKHMNGGLAAH